MLKKILREATNRGIEPMAAALPKKALRSILNEATVGLNVALCFHRVLDAPRPFMLQPELAHSAKQLDSFLDLFRDVSHRLVMSFDDGYEDARAYIASRAPDHPDVRWLFMVCPAKLEDRKGFSWDSFKRGGQDDPLAFAKMWEASADRQTEHQKPELEGLADDAEYLLSTVDQVAALSSIPNVELGDHTDHHIPTAWMSGEDVEAELSASKERFTRLFGPPKHFAFPYGTPDLYVLQRDIEIAKKTHGATTWTVDVQPFAVEDAVHGAVLPRFAWNSLEMTPKGMALYIAMKCASQRAANLKAAI